MFDNNKKKTNHHINKRITKICLKKREIKMAKRRKKAKKGKKKKAKKRRKRRR